MMEMLIHQLVHKALVKPNGKDAKTEEEVKANADNFHLMLSGQRCTILWMVGLKRPEPIVVLKNRYRNGGRLLAKTLAESGIDELADKAESLSNNGPFQIKPLSADEVQVQWPTQDRSGAEDITLPRALYDNLFSEFQHDKSGECADYEFGQSVFDATQSEELGADEVMVKFPTQPIIFRDRDVRIGLKIKQFKAKVEPETKHKLEAESEEEKADSVEKVVGILTKLRAYVVMKAMHSDMHSKETGAAQWAVDWANLETVAATASAADADADYDTVYPKGVGDDVNIFFKRLAVHVYNTPTMVRKLYDFLSDSLGLKKWSLKRKVLTTMVNLVTRVSPANLRRKMEEKGYSFPLTDVTKLQHVFVLIDRDSSGDLTPDEIETMPAVSKVFNEQTAKQKVASYNPAKDNEVTMFRDLDKDNSGTLDVDEFCELGVLLGSNDLRDIFEETELASASGRENQMGHSGECLAFFNVILSTINTPIAVDKTFKKEMAEKIDKISKLIMGFIGIMQYNERFYDAAVGIIRDIMKWMVLRLQGNLILSAKTGETYGEVVLPKLDPAQAERDAAKQGTFEESEYKQWQGRDSSLLATNKATEELASSSDEDAHDLDISDARTQFPSPLDCIKWDGEGDECCHSACRCILCEWICCCWWCCGAKCNSFKHS
eukprot:gnl/MRDRNA2_/MRDRNA2_18989_c0_seq1.p1 gnl/MRDRNA2_/MRDRNA2_18989_c0~~gnl/MRDRNA2_/MRDRNA2_18989_c0_seq1.p1  ORF type:complete len:742 (+),score=146.15 gnl/MRDRNA2_/MRDRNA2_18989_c0_seq1:243-2228(+)